MSLRLVSHSVDYLASRHEPTSGKDDLLGCRDLTRGTILVNKANTGCMCTSIPLDKVDLVNQCIDDNVDIASVLVIGHKVGAGRSDAFVVGSGDVSATMRGFTIAEHVRN